MDSKEIIETENLPAGSAVSSGSKKKDERFATIAPIGAEEGTENSQTAPPGVNGEKAPPSAGGEEIRGDKRAGIMQQGAETG